METNNRNDFLGNRNSRKVRSIYERASTDGAWLGLWFIGIFALSVLSMALPIANIAVIVLALLVPFLAYRCLRRTFEDSHGAASFSTLWMQGIVMFGCASLILCVATFIFMRWIYPDFILDTLRMGIEFYSRKEMGEAGMEMAEQLQLVISNKLVPSPMTVSVVWLWCGLFSGSVLSMVLSALARIRRVH
jgi:hypothetical protein